MPALQLDNLDKSTWQTFRFEQIARSIGERVEPSETSLETYVGLDHIDPESIHIKRFGTRDDVSGTKLRCYPGDVIFGRRRAYQRKAAICEFDGFCSAHSLVLRANPKVIDPKLFPFFLHSDTFMHRAVDISVGSLSPTINWTTLKTQEFLLPPKDQQAKLAELLWATDKNHEDSQMLSKRIERLIQANFKSAVFAESKKLDSHFGRLCSKHPVEKTGKHITQLQYGITESFHESEGIPALRMNNIQDGCLDLRDLKYSSSSLESLKDHILNRGDILFNRTNSFDLVGKVSLFDLDEIYTFASYLIRIKVNEDTLDPRFLSFFFNTELGKAKIRKYRTPGVSQSNINAQNIRLIRIPIPPIDVQRALMNEISANEIRLKMSFDAIQNAKTLLKSLINQIF